MIEQKIQQCNICGDLPKPKCNSFKYGNSIILIIGESPAKNGWLASGRVFYDSDGNLQATGKVLSKLLALIDLTIEDISFTECCKCHVANRTDLSNCAKNCKKYLIEQIEKCHAQIILTMGIFPTQVLLDRKIDRFKDIVGKKYEYRNKIIIPIYHPSPVNPLGFKGNAEIFKNLELYIK